MIKVSSYELQMTVLVYNYIILEYNVFILLDLYQIAIVCSLPCQLHSPAILTLKRNTVWYHPHKF